jgi:chaperonin cofactor prefoldin
MADNPQIAKKTIEILIATERVADQILANKREIVALDKRRQDNREAIRGLEKRKDQDKTWITLGSMLVKMRKERAVDIMNKGWNLQ